MQCEVNLQVGSCWSFFSNFYIECAWCCKMNLIIQKRFFLSLGVSIFLDVVSIETLDLDTEKKSVSTWWIISTVFKSKSRRLRNLDFVSTHPKSPKSLDRDREICRDMTFLANRDSFSRSRSRVSQCYHSSRSRFLNLLRFYSLKSRKSLEKVSTISINILTKINLDQKILTEIK